MLLYDEVNFFPTLRIATTNRLLWEGSAAEGVSRLWKLNPL